MEETKHHIHAVEVCDDEGKCTSLDQLMRRVDAMENDILPLVKDAVVKLEKIEKQNETQLEMMEAWNNAKGFVKTVRVIGTVTKYVAGFAAAVAAIWAFFHGGTGK